MIPILIPDLEYTTTTVSVSNSTARSAALYNGIWKIKCSCDVFLTQGDSTVTAATATGIPLFAGEEMEIFVKDSSSAYLAAITSAASGTLYIYRAKPRATVRP